MNMLRWGLVALVLGCGEDHGSGDPDAASSPDAGSADASTPILSFDAATQDAAMPDAAGSATAELRYRNGSRLKRIAQRGEGAVDLLVHWYDTLLDTDCTFSRTAEADEVLRCLPPSAHATSLGVFVDENCASSVVSLSSAAACSREQPVPKFTAESSDCAVLRVVSLSPPPSDLATRPLFKANPGGTDPCVPASANDTATARSAFTRGQILISGAEVPLSMFVKTVREEHSDGTPNRLGTVGEDGSLQLWGYTNPDGKRCTPTHVGDLDLCLPKLGFIGQWYADTSCTTPLIEERQGVNIGCPYIDIAPASVGIDRGTSCSSTVPRFYSFGSRFESPRYRLDAATCMVDGGSTSSSLYQRGEELQSGMLSPMQSRLEGSGRLRVRSLLDDRGRRVAVDTTTAWDDQLKQACTPVRVIGEKTYCVPETSSPVFKDTACTQPLLSMPCGQLNPGNLVLGTTGSFTAKGCLASAVLKLGERLPANTATYVKLGDACIANPTLPGAVYESAGEVPVTALAEMPRTITQ
jgi:hypothetical protein